MFGKKVLSFIGLSVLGIQLVSGCAVTVTNGGSRKRAFSCNVGTTEGCVAGDYLFDESNNYLGVILEGGTTCNEVTTPGFYKLKDGSYVKVVHTTYTASPVTSSAGETTPGNIDSNDNSLILDSSQNKITMGDSGIFLYADTNSVFVNGGTGVVALTSPDTTSIVLKSDLTTEDYCILSNKKIAASREAGLCTAGGCTSYMHCEGGICEDVTAPCKRSSITCTTIMGDTSCDGGKYFYDSDDKVYTCTGSSPCSLVNDGTTEIAYYVNSKGEANYPYIYCNGSNCSKVDLSAEVSDCTSKKAGDIIKTTNGIELCFTGVADDHAVIGASTKYIIGSTSAANAFDTAANSYNILESDTNSNLVLRNSLTGAGYYTVGKSTFALVSDTTTDSNVYKCNTSAICTKETVKNGYYLNGANEAAQQYIKCIDSTCKGITITNNSATCSADGNIVYDGTNFFLCLDSNKKVQLDESANNGKMYFVNIGTNTNNEETKNPFGIVESGYFAIADVTVATAGSSVLLHTEESIKYRYATNDDLLIHTTNDQTICGVTQDTFATGSAKEYVMDKCDSDVADYYKEKV